MVKASSSTQNKSLTHQQASTFNLIETKSLSVEDVQVFLKRAAEHKQYLLNNPVNKKQDLLAGQVVVNLFVENSTRTRTSFELAAKYLGAEVVNFDVNTSAFKKGETFLDTLNNLMAMGVDAFVVRHPQSGILHSVEPFVGIKAVLINAGDGQHEHPSQGLLDLMTMTESAGDLKNKKVVILGDITHSRVARSNIHLLKTMGANVVLCGPKTLVPLGLSSFVDEINYDLESALVDADFVMTLRLQLERQEAGLIPSLGEYHKLYGLTHQNIQLAKPSVKVLHPGPMNRDIEITSALADDTEISLILNQVQNGVAMRMAIIETLLNTRKNNLSSKGLT